MNAICAAAAANSSLALPTVSRACAIRNPKVNSTAKNNAAIAASMKCFERSTRLSTKTTASGSCAISQILLSKAGSQTFQSECEPRFRRPERNLQHGGHVGKRHLFAKVQDQHGAARRSQ